jgi:hypothetical protein
VLLVALTLLGGCDAGIRVVGFGTTGGGTSGGGGGGGSNPAALAGTWRNVSTLMLSSGETAVFDVRWTFDASGACSRTRMQTIVSGNSGSETTDTIGCTFVFNSSSITVSFTGSSVPSTFSVGFLGNDLLLAGTRFTRLA